MEKIEPIVFHVNDWQVWNDIQSSLTVDFNRREEFGLRRELDRQEY